MRASRGGDVRVSTTETDDLPGEREDRVRDAYGGLMKSNTSSSSSSVEAVEGGRGECEEEPRDREERGKRSPGVRREHGGMKSFERRRTDVGRCFYERPAVCVDVNYIGGHEEQIAAPSDAAYVYERERKREKVFSLMG